MHTHTYDSPERFIATRWGARYGHHATVPVPEGGVTWGFTAASYARGGLFTVKPEVCPTPYRARAPGYITHGTPYIVT